ncbi:hypothetical protein B0H10DRAFT_2187564 [Mycena sp. CBHHK59/15]|nr:hypothetical protein B0H10DRAFT_2187564 [Mycena sp. CBHHK59/15]
MMLTAGRIWWVTRTQRAVFGSAFTPRYNAAIAIILESGAIYCLGLVFQVVALSVQDSFPTAVYLSHGTAGQLVNIAPTLIVLRVGLGHAVPTAATDATTTVPQSRVNNNSRSLRFALLFRSRMWSVASVGRTLGLRRRPRSNTAVMDTSTRILALLLLGFRHLRELRLATVQAEEAANHIGIWRFQCCWHRMCDTLP